MLSKKRRQSQGTKSGMGRAPAKKEKAFNEKISKDDEEIASESEGDANIERDLGNDDFFETQGRVAKRTETADQKRLRMAKDLIKKIGAEEGEKEVDAFVQEEMKKERAEHFVELVGLPNFDPTEQGFFKGHLSTVTSLDIAFDCNQVITASRDCCGMKWDLQTGKKSLMPEISKMPLYACAYSPDSRIGYFGGSDKMIHVVDLHNEKKVHSFKAHNDTITGIDFDENKEQFYSCSNDNTMKVWGLGQTNKGVLLETFYGHISKINSMDLLPAGLIGTTQGTNRVLTCGSDKSVHLWKIDAQSFLQFKDSHCSTSIDCIAGLDKETFVTGDYNGAINLWKINKKKPVYSLKSAHGIENSMNFSPAFFTNGQIEEHPINNLQPVLSLTSVKNSDLLTSGSSAGTVNFYKHSKNKIEFAKSLELSNSNCLNCMKVSRSREFMVVGNSKDGRLGRWDVKNQGKSGITVVKLFA